MRNGFALLLAAAFAVAAPLPLSAQAAGDTEGVRRAALDYIEAFYEGDVSRIRRSVRPEVQKVGFFRDDPAAGYSSEPMTFAQMIEYAERVRSTGRGAPAGAPKEVRVLDVMDQTAAASVTAWWGTDYLQLAKYEGRWMIVHVLWQSPPPSR